MVDGFADYFPSIENLGGVVPVPVARPQDLAVGKIGPQRLGGRYIPPTPATNTAASVTAVRMVDASLDPALALTWALTYLPSQSPVVAGGDGENMAGVRVVQSGLGAGVIPAALGFPNGTRLLDSRTAKGILQLGQGGVRSGRLEFDWSAGGVLEVPAGVVELLAEVNGAANGGVDEPGVPFVYPAPLVPPYIAYLSPAAPGPARSRFTDRLLATTDVINSTWLAFAVPVGAQSWFITGQALTSGAAVPPTGVIVGVSRAGVPIFQRSVFFTAGSGSFSFSGVGTPIPMPGDVAALYYQIGGGFVVDVNTTVGYEMAW